MRRGSSFLRVSGVMGLFISVAGGVTTVMVGTKGIQPSSKRKTCVDAIFKLRLLIDFL